MFKNATPESMGISSGEILSFIKMLDDYRMHIHSFIMARGDSILAEAYYKPFHKDFLHRMYSVSKSFTAIAVGAAVTEGLFSLDDVIIDFFPEYRSEITDEFHDMCTVRDMLSMRSNIGSGIYWWGKFDSRIGAYYSQKTAKVPGTLFFYDSIGSFLLGCMIEKLTGKTFLEYLKEKVLLDIGFSRESYVLREPGGFAIGDSGVMCTARDLLLFARFILNKGEWNGKQLINRTFMEDAVGKQSFNDLGRFIDGHNGRGYGYLIWRTHEDGFTLTGLGDQLAICDQKHDFIFTITADNQDDRSGRHLIFHELYRHFLPKISDVPLPENPEAYRALRQYLDSRELYVQYGTDQPDLQKNISGCIYKAKPNSLGISEFSLSFSETEGSLKLVRDGKAHTIPFGICHNVFTKFSFGERAKADMMGCTVPGEYDCAVSAAWADTNVFAIQLQVIDTYFGRLEIHFSFRDTMVSMHLKRGGQYIFEGMDGYVIGTAE